MRNITSYNDIPDNLRQCGHYPYLNNSLKQYWFHALDVAHHLIKKFDVEHDRFETYYQDQFGSDFIAGLKNNGIALPTMILGEFALNYNLHSEEKKSNRAWIGYQAAIEELKLSPRGSQILVHVVSSELSHWEARIHVGDQEISACSTMKRYLQKPPAEAAIECLLRYEAYLARKQADRENVNLANYARIRELDLRPGLNLRDVEVYYNDKRRKISFEIATITPDGCLLLQNGKLRGSSKIFSATKEAVSISAANLVVPSVKDKKVKEQSEDTCDLF